MATAPFRVAQARQIVHLADLCNACGTCETFCVHQGKPYRDKPRLYLSRAGYDAEPGNACHLARTADGWSLRRREKGGEAVLSLAASFMTYEDAFLKVMLSPDWQVEEMVLKAPFAGKRELTAAAEMYVLAAGLVDSLPFLPYPAEVPADTGEE